MKHRKIGKQFGRVKKQRQAMFRSMLGSLVVHERIETTEAKAKELRRYVDRVITRAKRAPEGARQKLTIARKLEGDVPREAIKKISHELLPRLAKRSSGYTRVVKLPRRRSDSAKMAVIEFVDQDRESTKADKKEAGAKHKDDDGAKKVPTKATYGKERTEHVSAKNAPAAPDKSFHRPAS